MSDKNLRLTFEQVEYVKEQTEISDGKKAVEYFATLMMKEGIRPRQMPELVAKMMQKQRKQIR